MTFLNGPTTEELKETEVEHLEPFGKPPRRRRNFPTGPRGAGIGNLLEAANSRYVAGKVSTSNFRHVHLAFISTPPPA